MKSHENCANLSIVFGLRKKFVVDCEVIGIAYPLFPGKAKNNVLVSRFVVVEGKTKIHFVGPNVMYPANIAQ